MKKWELARYLIDNKKVIDNLMFIEENKIELSNLDLYEIITSKLRMFYINLSIIYDDYYKNSGMTKNDIKDHKKNNALIEKAYYERDKFYAHKDDDYQKTIYSNKTELIKDLKKELEFCLSTCQLVLPKEVTLNYIPYDRNLYRFIHNITPEKEKHFKEHMYSKIGARPKNSKQFKMFNDTEDYKYINKVDINRYAVKMDAGINIYEGLQNRQDSLIKINLLFDQNMWVTPQSNIHQVFEDSDSILLELMN